MRILTLVLPAVISCLALTGCPDSKKKSKSNIIRIKGDPMAFVKHTQMNAERGFDPSALDPNNSYEIYVNGFSNEITDRDNFESKVKEQTPRYGTEKTENTSTTQPVKEQFYSVSKGQFIRLIPKNSSDLSYHFLPQDNGRLKLVAIGKGSNMGTPVDENLQVLHYSSSPDGQTHSMLLLQKEPNSPHKTLAAVYFRKVDSSFSNLILTSLKYQYLIGKGVKTPLKNDGIVDVHYCYTSSESPTALRDLFQKGLNLWNEALSRRLHLRGLNSVGCPPFSDVNTRTFAYIEDWIDIPGPAATLGVALYAPDTTRSEIFDSDIFIFLSEIQEEIDLHVGPGRLSVKDPRFLNHKDVQQQIGKTVTHELGHMLTLHHEFHGNKSIMNYDLKPSDHKENSLTAYDIEAVQELYPIREDVPPVPRPARSRHAVR